MVLRFAFSLDYASQKQLLRLALLISTNSERGNCELTRKTNLNRKFTPQNISNHDDPNSIQKAQFR